MKTRNRLFAILLAFAMVITYMPAMAFALDDPVQEDPLNEQVAEETSEAAGDAEEIADDQQDPSGEGSGQEAGNDASAEAVQQETPATEGGTPVDKEATKGLYLDEELTMSGSEYSVRATAASGEIDSLWFDGAKNGEGGEWAHFYRLSDKDDTISLSDMNVSVKDEEDNVIDPANYNIRVERSWWEGDTERTEEVSDTTKIGLPDYDKESGFSEYALIITGKDGSGYSGEIRGSFIVMDEHSLNFLCSEASYGNAVWVGDWRMHQSFRFSETPVGLSVVQALAPDAPLTENVDYTVTYYRRGADSDDWEEMFDANDETRIDGVPSEPGEYFAQIEGIGDYYGGNDLIIDIGGLFLVDDGAPDLWSNGEKEYTVISNLEGDVGIRVGIHGDSDLWAQQAWELVLDNNDDELGEGESYYSYDSENKKLILHGDTIFRKIGEHGLDIHAYVIGDDPDDVQFYNAFVDVREARLDYDFKEDRDILPGWNDRIETEGNVFIRDREHPWGEQRNYSVRSVEVLSGVDLLDREFTEIEEVKETVDGNEITKHYLRNNGWEYWFQIINIEEWTERQQAGQQDDQIKFRVNYKTIDDEDAHYDFTVNVVDSVYEVNLVNPDERFEGLPGHEFDLRAEGRHKYYDENGEYHDESEGLTYKWSYAIGSDENWTAVPDGGLNNDFVEITVDNDVNGHFKFKALPEGRNDEMLFMKVELVGESGQGAQESLCSDQKTFRCCNDYTLIWPNRLDDIEISQKIENRKFEVRQYSSEIQQADPNDRYEVIPSEDVEFTWHYDNEAVRITDKNGAPVPDGAPATGDTFSIERLKDWGLGFHLEARWEEVVDEQTGRTEERVLDTEYRFYERDYNLEFDHHDHWLYSDIYEYNEAHKDDPDFEPEDHSHRLNVGRLGPDWQDTFEVVVKAGHWKDNGNGEGGWIEDEMLDGQGGGFWSLFIPDDYTVEVGDDGNISVALTERYLKKVKDHDDIRIEASLYLKDSTKDEQHRLNEPRDAWFHIEEAHTDYWGLPQDELIMPDQGGAVNCNERCRVENTEFRGAEFDYEITAVEVTGGHEYLVDEVVKEESGKYYLIKNGDKFDYHLKRDREVAEIAANNHEDAPAVSFDVYYKGYDYQDGDDEMIHPFTREIVRERNHTWIELNGAPDIGGPGAEFTLIGAGWHEFINNRGEEDGTEEGFTFGYEITEGADYATLTHEEGSPIATLKFKDMDIPEQGLDERIRVRIIAYRADENGQAVEVASGEREFCLTDSHIEMFVSYDGGTSWVTNRDPDIMPGESADVKFQLRQYDSRSPQADQEDAIGKYYVVDPAYSWDFDASQVKIYAMNGDVATELQKDQVVNNTDTFRFKRLDNNEIRFRLITDYGDGDDPFDYGMRFEHVDSHLDGYRIELTNYALSKEYRRIVIEDGSEITDPEFEIRGNGASLPQDAYTITIQKATGRDDDGRYTYGNEPVTKLVHGDEDVNSAYKVSATLNSAYAAYYEGEIEPYEFEVFSNKSILAYSVDFVDMNGDPIWYGPEDMTETPDFEDCFYKAHGVSARPRVFIGRGETVLDPEYYEAHYSKCEFQGDHWEPISGDVWSTEFPSEDGVYICVINGVEPYYGMLTWIDPIKFEAHHLVKHDAKAATTTAEGNREYWSCEDCGKYFSDAEGKTEIPENSWVIPQLISISKATVTGVANKVYTGKAITQKPVVKLGGKTLVLNKDYKLTYKNNKNVGTATVTITGIGVYGASINKTFAINPKGTTISKLTAAKKGFTAKWKKQATQTTGYELQYALNSKFTSGKKTLVITKNSIVSKKVAKLKAKKKYYVRVRTYRTVSKKKYYSAWSAVKAVTTKK